MSGAPASTGSPAVHILAEGGERIGAIVIDSTLRGRARGGLRMVPELVVEELADAARTMTLKYGLLGLPQGGAKAAVIGDPEAPPARRRRLLERFARLARPWLAPRRYVPDADLGTSTPEIRRMMREAGYPVHRREWRDHRSGTWTAHSVFAAVRVAWSWRGRSLAGATAAVEGFGRVGAPLAALLAAAGVRVVAVSTSRGALIDERGLDVERLLALAGRHGSASVEHWEDRAPLSPHRLPLLSVDLLCPCARGRSIHEGNAAGVRAAIVCGGANNPLSEGAEEILASRGVLTVPDFVANCGGVLGGTMAFAGLPDARISAGIEGFVARTLGDLRRRARAEGASLRRVAERVSRERHRAVRERYRHRTPPRLLLELGLALHRRGCLPAPAVGLLAARFFFPSLLTGAGRVAGR